MLVDTCARCDILGIQSIEGAWLVMDSQRALEIATGIAEHHGEPHPGSIFAVTSTYGRAGHAVFGSSDHAYPGHTPVLVIQMRGDFVGLHHPPHTPPPTGPVLTAIVDVETESLLGIRIARTALDLAPLGPTEPLNVPE